MKTLIILLALSFSFNCFAQDQKQTKKIFLRIFNAEGQKIAKGKLLEITDSTLTLNRNKKTVKISYSDIGTIKTKRSFGNNVGVGTAIGAGSMALIGAAAVDSNSNSLSGNGFWLSGLIGAPVGAVVGGVTGLLKKKELFEINGNQVLWETFKSAIQQ